MEDLLLGIGDALSPDALLAVLFGILMGYVVGVLPGLSRPTALAVAVPLTYYLSPVAAIAFLVGITKASAAGGATSAIMLNTPGEPSSAATCYDGYPMARAGKGKKALKIALYASVFGDIVSTLMLIALAKPLAAFALKFGPVEMTAIMIFALTFIAALSGGSMFRGMISGILGIFIATVGLDAESGTPRLTFGMVDLFDGVPLIATTVGMLAFAEMLLQAEALMARKKAGATEIATMEETDTSISRAEVRRVFPTLLRSTGIGVGAGIIPGLGPTIGAFLSYAVAKKLARPGDTFGEGDIKGVAATEAADNAVLPASLIPLFAIGLPGSVSAAVLVSAFMVHGITPGPLIFEENAALIYGVYFSMIIASLVMLAVGRIGLTFFARIGSVSPAIIIPVVFALCVSGTFLEAHSMFAVNVMFVFGVLGYIMQRYGYSVVAFLIGFVVGPMFELSLRQALIVTGGRLDVWLEHPIALTMLAISAVAAVVFMFPGTRKFGGAD